jgi:serine protease inhibitor
MINKMINF